MLRYAIARHARKASFVAASCCALLTCAATIALSVNSQWQSMAAGQQMASDQVVQIRQSVSDTLRQLNREYHPDCRDSSLTALRQLQFLTQQVGDFGVLDDRGRLICSAVAGVLSVPMELNHPDTVMHSVAGEEIGVSFLSMVRAIDSATLSTEIRLGRFDAVVSPYAMQDLLHTGMSALQLVNPKGGIYTAVLDDELSPEWKERLRTSAYAGKNQRIFSWKDWAFVATTQVPQSAYFIQTMVPASDFFQDNRRWFVIGLGLALLMALLVYQALLPVFVRWRALEYRIEKLLTDKNLICMYQPIIDLATQRTVGCEVLMRLHDGNAMLPPDQAIPAIIARGLTWELDQRVVRKAVAELAQHLPGLKDFKVAFNFFPVNVTSDKIETLFAEVQQQTPHPGLLFDIEVLEQAYGDSIVVEIAKLRKNHFLFSVDDFGTGYSNLGSIKAISPDFLKIDRSFVRDMEDASLRSSLIPEIIGIARAVGAEVIAEGIENAQQLDMLRALGVEYGQGYYFARPQAIEGLAQYLVTSPLTSP